jgi:hypothetical protein
VTLLAVTAVKFPAAGVDIPIGVELMTLLKIDMPE